jgi:hypothetical protein
MSRANPADGPGAFARQNPRHAHRDAAWPDSVRLPAENHHRGHRRPRLLAGLPPLLGIRAGECNISSGVAASLLAISILGQLLTLWRALQLEDDEPVNYRKTLRWFLWSVLVLLVAVSLSTLSFSRLLKF